MKLRIRQNTVRFRLARPEVEKLASGQPVEQATAFSSNDRLVCSIVSSSEPAVLATFTAGQLTLRLPADQIRRWAASDQVSITAQQRIDEARSMQILVEKDFECLHPGHESDPGAYPNPYK